MVEVKGLSPEENRWALTGLAQNPTVPLEDRLQMALQVIKELEAVRQEEMRNAGNEIRDLENEIQQLIQGDSSYGQ